MIQFNLLPDVKLDYIKAQRSARLVTSVAVLISGVAIALLLVLLSIDGLQKKHLNDLSRDIKSESSQLQNIPQIDNILTVQNQLGSLTTLHNQKPAVTRLFGYLNELTPNQISISSLHIDFTQDTASITGSADALSTVNKFVDTLKFTTYTTASGTSSASGSDTSGNNTAGGNDTSGTKAFSNVVLSNFGLNANQQPGSQAPNANYTITFGYDPAIFDNTQQVNLAVPNLVTTRSQLDQPNDLFIQPPAGSNQPVSGSTGGQ